MVLKKARQNKIADLIQRHDIQTQEEMILRLEESGYPVTQATVSRDIRELGLVKGLSPRGIYRYTLPQSKEGAGSRFTAAVTEFITSVDYAGNIVVIKTYPGHAGAVATCVDSMNMSEVVGTIAGDDAIFIVVRQAESASAMCDKLKGMIQNL